MAYRSIYSRIVTLLSLETSWSIAASFSPLLHLQPQEVGFGTARGLTFVAALLVEDITAFVEGVYLRLALVFSV